jgi:hypothetical protein
VKRNIELKLFISFLLATFSLVEPPYASASAAATATILTISSGGTSVTSVEQGTAVTLTAAVSSGATKLTTGQVNFCDASVSYCTDIHLLGTAQLTSAGTASVSLSQAIGAHSYKAVFAGTPKAAVAYAASASSVVSLTVTGTTWPSVTQIAQSGSTGNYTLTATVGGNAATPPTGTISFLNTSNSNAVLGTAPLGSGTTGLNFLDPGDENISLVGLDEDPADALNPSVAIADFNGDGFLDVAVASSGGCDTDVCWNAEATVFLGDGKGKFAAGASTILSPNLRVSSVAVGDFNGDGIPDLALWSFSGNSITILFGKGDGTFAIKGTIATGGDFLLLLVGDFNGDGIPDLAELNTTSDMVNILLGNGDGTFTASTAATSSTGDQPCSWVEGDFNGDGIPDLAIVANCDGQNNGLVTILLGNGDGTFSAAASPATGIDTAGSTVGLAIGDFNGDGNLDLAIASAGSVTFLLGAGDGTFTQASGSPVALSTDGFLAAGDFNGDGKLDLAVTPKLILTGNGDGTFTIVTPAVGLNSSGILRAADFNGDGATDLINLGDGPVVLAVTQTASATAANIAATPGTDTQSAVASYPGDSSYAPSTSGATTLDAAQATPAVSLAATPTAVTFGTAVTLTATVTGGGLAPTGTVTFYDGSAQLGTGALNSSGIATYVTSALPVGSNSVLASYGGDPDYLVGNSAALVVTVTAPGTTAPTVTITPSSASITTEQALTVSVTVSGAAGAATPTGAVTLTSGAYTAQQPLSSGTTTFSIPAGTLGSGADTLTASYTGDAVYAAGSATAGVAVSQLSVAIPTPSPVSPGTSATATATFSAGSTYTGTLLLTCSLAESPSGAQSLPTCSLNPTSVALKPGGNGTSVLTVATTASSNSSLVRPARASPWGIGGGGAFLAVLLMWGVPSRRRRWTMLKATLLLMVIGFIAIGCGGGGSSTHGSSTPATTAGSYTFTVTGTDSANASLTTSTSVVVTVQ